MAIPFDLAAEIVLEAARVFSGRRSELNIDDRLLDVGIVDAVAAKGFANVVVQLVSQRGYYLPRESLDLVPGDTLRSVAKKVGTNSTGPK
jgi:hypothetical protein